MRPIFQTSMTRGSPLPVLRVASKATRPGSRVAFWRLASVRLRHDQSIGHLGLKVPDHRTSVRGIEIANALPSAVRNREVGVSSVLVNGPTGRLRNRVVIDLV